MNEFSSVTEVFPEGIVDSSSDVGDEEVRVVHAPILVEPGFKLIVFIFAGLVTFLLKRRANKRMKLNEDLKQKKLAVSQDSTDTL